MYTLSNSLFFVLLNIFTHYNYVSDSGGKMTETLNIAIFEGDGIGPEIIHQTLPLLEALSARSSSYKLELNFLPAGAKHYQKTGISLPDSSLEKAQNSDAILLSAMGLPSVRYEDGTEISPQIELRKKLYLYAGVRPVTILANEVSPLKIPEDKTVDFVLIRESTEGLFFSQGSKCVSHDEARETLCITRKTSEKLFKFAFNLAKQRAISKDRQGRVTCVDKANVFSAFAFFREIFDKESKLHESIKSDHAYVDAMALWMVEKPWEFDVLVTENMFGDILSDLGAGLMGGLGLAPSADIGDEHALFQPCHGSAPDIAGNGTANPAAMILSAAMMLDWLGHKKGMSQLNEDAKLLDQAVRKIIASKKFMTHDLGGTASTKEFSDAVHAQMM